MKIKTKGQNTRSKCFQRVHYEDMWSLYDKCKEIVQQEWIDPNRSVNEDPVQLFSKKVNVTLIELKTWSKIEFKGKKKLEQLVNELRDMSTIL